MLLDCPLDQERLGRYTGYSHGTDHSANKSSPHLLLLPQEQAASSSSETTPWGSSVLATTTPPLPALLVSRVSGRGSGRGWLSKLRQEMLAKVESYGPRFINPINLRK